MVKNKMGKAAKKPSRKVSGKTVSGKALNHATSTAIKEKKKKAASNRTDKVAAKSYGKESETTGNGANDLAHKHSKVPFGWLFRANHYGDYEAGIDTKVAHSGTRCAYMKSLVPDPKPIGNLLQMAAPTAFLGKRLCMSAWVKTDLVDGTCQLWLRIDRPEKSSKWHGGTFDNMDDRPIRGKTGWTQYHLVVNVPDNSVDIAFGMMLNGKGQCWLDDVSFKAVSKDTPLTGMYSRGPVNLDFQEDG